MKPHIKDKLKKAGKNTKRLQLSTGRLKDVPKEVEGCSGLVNLDLFGNNIESIPDWFFKLQKLKFL